MSAQWKRIDANQSLPRFLAASDQCYYARDYIARGSYGSSPTNSLIQNFKKDVARRGKPEWQHKLNAIRQFAAELRPAIADGAAVAHIPSSKCLEDPFYDTRFEDTLAILHHSNPSLRLETPFRAVSSMQAAHLGGVRDPSSFYDNLAWSGIGPSNGAIVLIDDVITSGSRFKACQRLLVEKVPGILVYGLFWAKSVWDADI